MSGKTDKKIRKVAQMFASRSGRSGRDYADSICKYPFRNKLRFCWDILTHKEWA